MSKQSIEVHTCRHKVEEGAEVSQEVANHFEHPTDLVVEGAPIARFTPRGGERTVSGSTRKYREAYEAMERRRAKAGSN